MNCKNIPDKSLQTQEKDLNYTENPQNIDLKFEKILKGVRYVIALTPAISIVLGLLTPDDIMKYPLAVEWTDVVSNKIASVAMVRRIGQSQSLAFIAANINVVWIIGTIFFSMLVFSKPSYANIREIVKTTTFKDQMILLFLALPFVSLLVYVQLFVEESREYVQLSWRLRALLDSKAVLIINGNLFVAMYMIFPFMIAICSAIVVETIKKIWGRKQNG